MLPDRAQLYGRQLSPFRLRSRTANQCPRRGALPPLLPGAWQLLGCHTPTLRSSPTQTALANRWETVTLAYFAAAFAFAARQPHREIRSRDEPAVDGL